ncbi:MAG: hypothetical protein QOI38_1276 [Sphingomonadales bacterium]|nr:hypothetical protein [Sphingomonadales bacterium]
MTPAVRQVLRRIGLLGRTTRTNLLAYLLAVAALNVALFLFAVTTVRASAPSAARIEALHALALANPLLAAADSLIFLWLAARRLHDQDRPGWLAMVPTAAGLLASFLPIPPALLLLLLIAFVVALFLPGTLGPNRYGPDPRGWRSRRHYEEERRIGRAG